MKKLLTKGISILCTAAMLCGTFAGCTGAEKLPEPTEAVNIFAPCYGDVPMLKALSVLHQAYPEVKMEYDTFDANAQGLYIFGGNVDQSYRGKTYDLTDSIQQINEYQDNLKTQLMKGGISDVVFADILYQTMEEITINDYNKLFQSGAFYDLLPLIEKYAPEMDLSAYESLKTADGKLYAIPLETMPFYLQGAEAILDEWNFEYSPDETILEFLRRCKAWQDANAGNPDAPAVFSELAWDYLMDNMFAVTGTVIDYSQKTAAVDTPEIIEIMGLLRELKSDVKEVSRPCQENYDAAYGKFLFGGIHGVYDAPLNADAYNMPHITPRAEHKTVLMPLRTLEGKVNYLARYYMTVPTNAANPVNGVRYIAALQQSYQESASKSYYNCYDMLEYGERAQARMEYHYSLSAQKCADGYKEVLWDMYEDRGDICMPSYWMANLSDLFDNYMRDAYTPEEFVKDVDSRLRIYLSE